jgi:diguanylate cyclase (GGDEF)-like protein
MTILDVTKMPSQYKTEMLVLQRGYVDRLRGIAATVKRSRELLGGNMLPRGELAQIYPLMQNYSGSGATFGFPDVSLCARDLYVAIRDTFADKAGAETSGDKDIPAARRPQLFAAMQGFENACRIAIDLKPQEAGELMMLAEPPVMRIEQGTDDVYLLAFGAERAQAEDAVQQLAQYGCNAVLMEDENGFRENFRKGFMKAVVFFTALSDYDTAFLKSFVGANANVPVILVAPYDDFEARLSAVRLGAAGYLAGKFEVMRLTEKIDRLAARHRPAPDYHVLVVDDDDMLTEFYRKSLARHGLHVSVVNDPKQALQVLHENDIDLILMDFMMPGCSGQEVATLIRQHEEYTRIPIIFIAPVDDIETLSTTAGLGVEDFLAKPFTPGQLQTVIHARARRAEDLKAFMVRDSFTGLFNHEHFNEILVQEGARARRTGGTAVYAIVDIDHFRQINNSYGHHAGDQIIKGVSRLLRQHLRTTDVIGRCGGEAFGIIMHGCDLEDARESLETLRQKITSSFFDVRAKKIRVTISAGAALIDGKSAVDDLIRAADTALAEAKLKGRNQVVAAA